VWSKRNEAKAFTVFRFPYVISWSGVVKSDGLSSMLEVALGFDLKFVLETSVFETKAKSVT